jgi:uncharacterized protein (TIGR04551 family)
VAFAILLLTAAPAARAQFGGQPGGMPPGGMGPAPMGEEPKEEGPAEEAPDTDEKAAEAEPIGGYAGQSRRVRKVVEIDGYMRLRSEFYHQFDFGQSYIGPSDNPERTPPFPQPLECGVAQTTCESKNLGGGNLRLRLEPTINVTDQVRVMAQVDVLDNLALGSTPDSLVNYRVYQDAMGRPINGPGSLSMTQVPPELGQNAIVSSIRAKRAWGEVDSEFGTLRFGRMPWHFGRGIAYNNGACADCDGETNVDRIVGHTQVYGHQITLAWDFGAQGHHIGMIDLGERDRNGFPLDLSQRDDVLQLMAAVSRIDDERRFQERAAQGDLVFNYAAQLVYRKQGKEISNIMRSMTVDPAAPLTREELSRSLVPPDLDATVFLPSLWFKLAWKSLTIEAEASGAFGKINNAGPLVVDPARKNLTIRQLGWVVASELRLYKNAFAIGFETGGATGDQAENPRTYLNYRWRGPVPQPAGDHTMSDFRFSPEYHVDEILFRRILGTVSNAIYAKPAMTYWVDLADRRQLGLSAAAIYSIAPVQVSTPGNGLSYGVEMNVNATYRNPTDGFYAGITWAVLWPMSALERPATTGPSGLRLWTVGQEASAAQALRTFLGIRF